MRSAEEGKGSGKLYHEAPGRQLQGVYNMAFLGVGTVQGLKETGTSLVVDGDSTTEPRTNP